MCRAPAPFFPFPAAETRNVHLDCVSYCFDNRPTVSFLVPRVALAARGSCPPRKSNPSSLFCCQLSRCLWLLLCFSVMPAVRKLRQVLESEATEVIVAKHIDEMFLRPEGVLVPRATPTHGPARHSDSPDMRSAVVFAAAGMMLMMGGFDAAKLKPLIMPFVVDMDAEIAPMVRSHDAV